MKNICQRLSYPRSVGTGPKSRVCQEMFSHVLSSGDNCFPPHLMNQAGDYISLYIFPPSLSLTLFFFFKYIFWFSLHWMKVNIFLWIDVTVMLNCVIWIWSRLPTAHFCRQILSRRLRDIAGSGIGLLCLPASLCSLAGRYDNPNLASDLLGIPTQSNDWYRGPTE